MNRSGRILFGVLAGMLLTLVIHPVSRKFIILPFMELGASDSLANSIWLTQNLDILPAPNDTLSASIWVQAGAEQLVRGQKISPDNLLRLIEVSQAAARGDPNNGFWLQMKAVFCWESGQREKAREAWIQASRASAWNDYQSRRLERVRDELADIDGGPMAWQSSAAYYQRSIACARVIEWVARGLSERWSASPDRVLESRLATLRNGRLLRDGSRSVAVGLYGAQLVEFAYRRFDVIGKLTPREMELARFQLVGELRDAGQDREALEVDDAFQTNDAWFALTQPSRAVENARNLAAASAITACIAGIFFGVALIGLVLLGLVALFERFPKLQRVFTPPFAPMIGVVAGVALYLQTDLVLAAVTVAMCFGFLAFEPLRARRQRKPRLRIGFRIAFVVMASLFIVMVGAFWLGIGTPAYEIVPNLRIPVELFGGNTVFLSLAVLVLSLLLLIAPGWAMVERVPTTVATVCTLHEFSRRVAWGALLCGLVATPIAVYVDNQVRQSMDLLLTNEPTHYLMQ